MKKKYNVLLLVLILILVGCFAISVSGVRIPYLENYGANFRHNIKGIAEKAGLDLPQAVDNYLSKTPEPLTTEEKLEIIERMEAEEAAKNATPTPDIDIKKEKTISAKSKIIAVKNAYTAEYENYNSMLLCASDTLLTCFDKNGNTKWMADIQVSNPILKTAENYILVAEKNGKKIYLFNEEKLLWENSSEHQIVSADVSTNGDVVIVSDKGNYKGVVTVVNRNGDVVFKWNSGKYEIIDADISPTSRTLAVVMLNTDIGADTKISFFDIKEKESFNSVDITDSLVFDVEYSDEILSAMADNKIIGINADGKIKWTKDFEEKTLHRYTFSNDGSKLCVFDNNNLSEISVISIRGSEKASFESEAFPECISILDGHLLYNHERKLYYSGLSGRNPKKYNCTRDIYHLLILGSESLAVVYNSSIEFINF